MQVVSSLLIVLVGVAVTVALYWGLHALVARFTTGARQRALLPYAFLAPAIVVVVGFLVFPTLRTFWLSFTTRERDENRQWQEIWVGFENYRDAISDPGFFEMLGNNLLWILVVPLVTMLMGLLIATISDRIGGRLEPFLKSVIFMPMAISFVAAGIIWGFIYEFTPAGQEQVGLLNALWESWGNDPRAWLQEGSWNINDLLLMVPVIWLQTGFAMVLISAAIKGVPVETIEASKIDGANAWQTFRYVVIPQIRTTLLAVFITILILVMKIFDIVYATTGGAFGTNVLGVEFFVQYFNAFNPGRASAIVVILFVVILPIVFYQVRVFRKQQAV